jgi:lysophospholipase L1-like esterase
MKGTRFTKYIFWLSLGSNLISIVVFTGLIIMNGGIDRLFGNTISNTNRSREQRNPNRIGYYQARKNLFAGLPDRNSEIILLGDSLTDQGEWVELLGNSRAIDRGISGDTTEGILKRVAEVIESKPEKIFLLIGINDILNEGKENNLIVDNYRAILKIFQQQIPATKVYIQSVLPINNTSFGVPIDPQQIVSLNRQIRALATEFNYVYIDLYRYFVDTEEQLIIEYTSDGIHLTAAGYLLWAQQIKPFVSDKN